MESKFIEQEGEIDEEDSDDEEYQHQKTMSEVQTVAVTQLSESLQNTSLDEKRNDINVPSQTKVFADILSLSAYFEEFKEKEVAALSE